ncbi:DUF3631 domain-containing protein [Microlunatus ginsengisoli]|uniref:DUF3631 domain-containing protein n=1 Tax=Microlunatus ginsengisoli TaxID=363863 RepID=A0ABP7ANS0_9ACTN
MLAELLDQIEAALCSYVVLPTDHAAAAVVLWIAATHAMPAWNTAPRLVIKAPEKRCGKSRLLDLIEAMSHRPILTANASPSAVYRCIGEDATDPPTLLIDESDTIFGPRAGDANEDLRGLLNAGHQLGRPALRWDAGSRRLDRIATFAMAALAGIGNMPDTIEDRAVIIAMRRRAPDETVLPYRARRDGPALTQLKTQLHAWVMGRLDQLERAAPVLPVEDRAADTWEPLVAIADAAGGHWPADARAAVLALTVDDVDASTVSLRVRLLIDVRTAFADADGLRSEVLVARLREDAEAPWDTLGKNGLNPKSLAALLRDFEIHSVQYRWDDGTQSKGFKRDQFDDAWRRYCPEPSSRRPAVPAVPPSHERENGTAQHPWDGSAVPTAPTRAWDGSAVPNNPSRPKSTLVGRRDGWDGKAQPTETATCISCRQPLSYDDGTHTHPTCTTSTKES